MRLSPSLITWLRCFVAAARYGSFTRAADVLHLTQSAVSQQVRHLETHLDCKLFHRLPGKLELSHYGRRLFQDIAPALQRIEQAVNELRAPAAQLHLSCSPSFASRWLMPRLGRFLRLHPEVNLHLRGEFHALSRERFISEGLHAAIRYDPFEYPDLVTHKLMDEYLVPVVSPEFLASHERKVSAEDYMHATLLHDSEPWDGAPDRIEWHTILNKLGMSVADEERGGYYNMAEMALAAARAGEGIAAARLALAIDDLNSGRLVPVLDHFVPAGSRYVLLLLESDDSRTEALLAWLQDECKTFSDLCQRKFAPGISGSSDQIVTYDRE